MLSDKEFPAWIIKWSISIATIILLLVGTATDGGYLNDAFDLIDVGLDCSDEWSEKFWDFWEGY